MDYSNIVEKYNKILEAQELLGAGSGKHDGPEISLPRIAVCGGQSAGKSSVLESVVGFEFLPRGNGIVTRRPLLVELSPSATGETKITLTDNSNNYSKEFSNAMEVKEAIKSATDNHEACRNNGVSAASLVVKISKPGLPYLTMIDLPGMTRNPIGNQPETISRDIQRLIMSYIDNDSTIILAVSPSTIDIANCEAVRIAREVDPGFQRTIGVFTKLDDGFYDSRGMVVPDAKEKAKLIMSNEKSYRGGLPSIWIPVKCRRTGINSVSIEDQPKEEKEFFENEFFPAMKFECPYGIQHLSQVLTDRLERELQKMWPNIEASVKALYKEKSAELKEWEVFNDEAKWTSTVDMVIDEYAEAFREQLLGEDKQGSLDGLWAGARIVDIFKGDFVRDMESIDPLEDFDKTRLATLIKNARGLDDGHFLQFGVLKRVVQHNLEKIQDICLTCVHSTCHELRTHAMSIPVGKNSSGNLTRWIHQATCAKLEEWEEDCVDLVSDIVEMERRINPDHPDYPRVLTYDEAKTLVLKDMEKKNPKKSKTKPKKPKKKPDFGKSRKVSTPVRRQQQQYQYQQPNNDNVSAITANSFATLQTPTRQTRASMSETPSRRTSSPGTMNPPTPGGDTDDPSRMSILTLRKLVRENGYSDEQTYRMRRAEMETIVGSSMGVSSSSMAQTAAAAAAASPSVTFTPDAKSRTAVTEDSTAAPAGMSGFLVDLDEDIPSFDDTTTEADEKKEETSLCDDNDDDNDNDDDDANTGYTPTRRATNARSNDEEIEIIRYLLVKVFDNVIRIKVIDSVPKAITLKLVEQPASRKLKHYLIDKINEMKDQEGGLRKLMGKTAEDERKQEECEKLVKKLDAVMHSFKG